MTEEPTSGTVVGDTGVRDLDERASEPAWEHEEYHGRPVSWVAVSVIMVGFVVGGLALIFGPTWWLFWASVGLVVVGGLIALSTNIFEDWY